MVYDGGGAGRCGGVPGISDGLMEGGEYSGVKGNMYMYGVLLEVLGGGRGELEQNFE